LFCKKPDIATPKKYKVVDCDILALVSAKRFDWNKRAERDHAGRVLCLYPAGQNVAAAI
jgi:hypothetical protein